MEETFGRALRRLRSARALTQPQLGKLVHITGGYVSEFELGRKPVTRWLAADLDEALGAAGLLIDLAAAEHAVRALRLPDWGDTRAAAAMTDARPDPARVGELASSLARQRLTEDTAGARSVLAPTLGHLASVESLRDASDGDLHRDALSLESQYAQFLGWCHQDLGNVGLSEQWYARALMIAHEADDLNMIASILSMRSNAAWGRGDIRRAVDLGQAATRPAASPGVLALSHQQAARGLAAAGERTAAMKALDLAAALSERARAAPDREPPWVYFANEARIGVQRAIALHELGDHTAAAALFGDAIDALPASYRRDRGTYLARMSAALAAANRRDEAAAAAAEAREIAEQVGSARSLREIDRAEEILAA